MRTRSTRRLFKAIGIAGPLALAAGLTGCEDPNEPTPAGDLANPDRNTGTGDTTGTGQNSGVSEDTQPSGDGDPAGSGQP